MKSSILKRSLSLLLAMMCLVGMVTMSLSSFTAAETDVATTDADTFRVYFQNEWQWPTPRIHYWGGSSSTSWPGKNMTFYKNNPGNNYGVYYYDVPADTTGIIFNGVNKNNSSETQQTPNIEGTSINKNGTTCYYIYWDNENKFGSFDITGVFPELTPELEEPDAPADTSQKTTIYFLDYAKGDDGKYWIHTNDAKIFINDGDKVTEMKETVDTISGHRMWYADVAVNTSYNFYRTSYFFDKSNAKDGYWNAWRATGRDTNTVYKATASGEGSWQAETTVSAASTDDIETFWDDLWITPVGKDDVYHAVKVWYNDADGKFNLFVPSYFDLSNVKVYTDAASVTIGDTTYSSGDTASLTTGTGITFKRGTTAGTINIYQTTSTAAMMMTTKEELFTGKTDALQNANAWPEGSDINEHNYNGVYKDAIETKGSYYFYTEDGTFLNSDDTVLKKIKGRGNSSFEASMRVYGKYAYNFNLDTKQELIEGSTASKKWCMLANNVDHTMMRNTFIYQLADELGLACAPETRLVDVYDNGKYLGAFVITEKVEYGKNTLMAKDSQGKTIKNLDDGNTDANSVFTDDGEDYIYEFDTDDLQEGIEDTLPVNGQNYKYKYYDKYDRPAVEDDDGNVILEGADNLDFVSPENYNTEYNYLLEHELASRYQAEASWFVTPNGQPVVVKYPEFATQEEMIWIINEYAAMEQAVYADNYDGENGYANLIDVESFAKMYLIQELAINLDSCATSYYIHNEFRNGKSVLVAGPVWDYDWSMGAYAGGKKWIYNGTTVSQSTKSLANPEQMFVKDKAIQTDGDGEDTKYGVTWGKNYNLQAKMAHNTDFWTVCQSIYTNDMVPVLYEYTIDDYDDETDGGILVDELLPKFQSSMDMNNARWGVYNFTDVEGTGDNWGTKVTSDYEQGTGITNTSNFKYNLTSTSGSSATKCYANTVYYLNDWLSTRKDYMSGTGDLYNADLKYSYTFKNVSFNYDQSADESTLSLKPVATVTYGSTVTGTTEVPAEELMYTVYVNGAPYQTYKFTEEATVKFEENTRNNVYIAVFPAADPKSTGESEPQEFTYGKVPVEVTIYFKSSSSYRYAPTLTVNGGSEIVMDKAEKDFNHNPSRTQKYYWYSCTVELDSAKASTLMFSNAYAMRATVSLSDVVENGEYYFGCDNMNNGSTAVNLTEYTGEYEYIRNFVKSATHMVYNEATDAGVATTSIDGTVYKMGDADGDNTVSILDATTVQMALVEKTDLDETQTALADYDLDQVNSIVDATLIQTYLVNN